jgi:hypothetical protein
MPALLADGNLLHRGFYAAVVKNTDEQHGQGGEQPHQHFNNPADEKKIDPPEKAVIFGVGIRDRLDGNVGGFTFGAN